MRGDARSFLAGLAGGLAGIAIAAVLLLIAAPQSLTTRIVRDGLLAEPNILIETADALRDRQHAPVLAAARTQLETPFGSSWEGAAKPDVVLVEFFDYACGYCKASLPHIERLLREDKGLRVVYREFPILGPDSVTAARLSLAASKAGKFQQFHDTLFATGKPAAATLAAAAQAAGIAGPPRELPEFERELRRNYEMAEALGGTGTPLFVVGDRVLNGAVGYEVLKDAIADARAGNPRRSTG